MATVDNLNIEISASVNKANASVETLIKKLERLTSSLSGVNSSGLNSLGAGINRLANATANFSKNTKASDFTRIAKDLQKLGSVDVSRISTAGTAITRIGNAMSGLNGMNFGDNAKQVSNMVKSLSSLDKINTASIKNATTAIGKIAGAINGIKGMNFGDNPAKISELAKSISSLGGKAATTAVTNIPQLANAMKQFMTTLSTAPKVSRNLIGMTNAMAMFARTGSSGGKAANALGASIQNMGKRIAGVPTIIKSFNHNTISMVGGLKSVASQVKSLIGIIGGIGGAFTLAKKSMDISSDLTEVQNVIDVTFGKYSKAIEDFSKISVTDFGMSELTAKQIAGRFQAMGTAIGYSQKQMSGMSVELTKLAADMASFYNVEQDVVATSLQSVFTGETEPLRKYGLDLTQTTLEEWAHKQGIDAKMKSMSQAEKVMLRYQYVMANTAAAQGDFARTADTWANQVRVLKQNFEILGATIGGALINALKLFVKGLNAIMGQINNFAKTISNALGKIFGWTYEEGGGVTNPADDMADSMGDVADATDDATKAQKKYNKQLSKFDELNNYTSNDKADKGKDSGVGDLSALGAGAGGAWTQGESMIKAYESDIDSLYKLGKKIGDTLKKAMDSIDWDEVYAKAESFGTGLANFLNGLISPGLFSSLGTTIAGALNTALHFLNSFGTTFDWKNFGNSIAAGINSFFKTFDFGLLATTFNTWANGILTSMITAVQGVDWKQIATKIAELINGIDAKGISWNLGKLVNSLANAFYQLVSNKSTWTSLGTKIADGINGFFSGMNDIDPKTGLTGFQALGKNISESISGIATTITTALKGVDWVTVGQSIGDFIASIDFGKVTWDLIKLANSLLDGIVDAITGFVKKAPLESAIVGLFATLKLTGIGSKLGTAINTALASKGITLSQVAITIAGVVIAAKAGFSIGKQIGNWIQDKISTEDMSQYRYNFKFSDLFTYSPSEWAQGIADMIVESEIDTTIQNMLTDMVTGNYHIQIGSFELPSWNDLKKKITNGINDVTGAFKELGKDIKKGTYKFKIGSFELPSWNQITSKIKTGISNIKGAFDELWKDIKSGNFKFKIGSFELPSWNEVETTVNTIWTNLKTWWDENVKLPEIKMPTIADIGKALKDIWSKAKSWWNSNVKLPKINLPTIADIKKKIQEIWKNTKSWWNSNVKLPKISLPTIADIKGKIKEIWENTKTWWKEHVKLPDIKFPTISTATVKSWLKPIVTVANSMIDKINSLMKVSWKDIKVAGKTIVPSGNFTLATIPKITGYATGGFPEDGWFRASQGEIMGRFDNGQSVVANNMQITKGISDAVQKGNQESVMLMRQEISMLQRQNDLLLGILQKDTGISKSEVFNAVRDENYAFYKRNGHGAFEF